MRRHTDFAIVDVCCKTGGALHEFRRSLAGQAPPMSACLGIDSNDAYRANASRQGFNFRSIDVQKPEAMSSAVAEYYLAYDALEHLESVEVAKRVLWTMLDNTLTSVHLRMPSFEQHQVLDDNGLRFYWTNWTGHTAHLLLSDVCAVAKEYAKPPRREVVLKIVDRGRITSSADPRIIPVTAPVDSHEYTRDMGPKPEVRFDPPLVPSFDVTLRPCL